jgi:hypothetical protein
MAIQIQLRRGTAAEWSSVNPVLAQGELLLELDTGRLKVGNGIGRWNDLPYAGFTSQGSDPSNWDQNNRLGLYFVNRQSWSGTSGTPTEASTIGLLTVVTSGDIIVQKYQPYDVGSTYGSEYVRIKLASGDWSDWNRTLGEGGFLDGGTF